MTAKFSVPNDVHLIPGYILIHKKWKDSFMYNEIKSKFNRAIIEDLGIYDFYVSDTKPVVYISETVLSNDVSFHKYDSYDSRTIFISLRNLITIDIFNKLQDYLVIEFGRKLLAIGNISELPQLLYQLSSVENTQTPHNQFKRKSKCMSENIQLDILMSISGLGKQKAQTLLDYFGTLYNIANAKQSDLSQKIGPSCASRVIKFFMEKDSAPL